MVCEDFEMSTPPVVRRSTSPASQPSKASSVSDRIAANRPLTSLLLDIQNPRFGDVRSDLATQTAVLDHIVANYGVDDVISSLAVNGYFKAEPLVGKENGQSIVIVEGNRRLAACLLLAGDPRASNQTRKASQYRTLWEQHGRPTIDPVPVITFDGRSDAELLSYLGVRHISASTPWDSYAKASWAAKVVATTALTVTDISIMIGDPHRTVARLLEGYFVIQQARTGGAFEPQDSVRKGRGSVTEYPFSWVYTILGYTAARKYLEMPETPPGPNPLPESSLPKVRVVLTAMFGSSSKGWNSVIQDSRALGDLASALIDPDKLRLIEKGVSLAEANRVTRPITERLLDNLNDIRRLQSEIVVVLAEEKISEAAAKSCHPPAASNRRTSSQIEKAFRDILFPEDEDA